MLKSCINCSTVGGSKNEDAHRVAYFAQHGKDYNNIGHRSGTGGCHPFERGTCRGGELGYPHWYGKIDLIKEIMKSLNM